MEFMKDEREQGCLKWLPDLFELFLAQFVLAFLRLQEAIELLLLLALDVLQEFLLVIRKSLGLERKIISIKMFCYTFYCFIFCLIKSQYIFLHGALVLLDEFVHLSSKAVPLVLQFFVQLESVLVHLAL